VLKISLEMDIKFELIVLKEVDKRVTNGLFNITKEYIKGTFLFQWVKKLTILINTWQNVDKKWPNKYSDN